MYHMVYYTRGNMIHFTIKSKCSETSGSDFKERLADIIEIYDVHTIERID